MKKLTVKLLSLSFLLFLACQETELSPDNVTDLEMETARSLSEDFLNNARIEEVTDVDVTVIKFSSDLLYKTNTIFGKYNPISEETITAESEPGGYVFWFGGSGVKELVEIEMDSASQAILDYNEPFEVISEELWALWIPSDIDDDIETLKYDIIYQNNSNQIIRLDPKIQIKSEE